GRRRADGDVRRRQDTAARLRTLPAGPRRGGDQAPREPQGHGQGRGDGGLGPRLPLPPRSGEGEGRGEGGAGDSAAVKCSPKVGKKWALAEQPWRFRLRAALSQPSPSRASPGGEGVTPRAAPR